MREYRSLARRAPWLSNLQRFLRTSLQKPGWILISLLVLGLFVGAAFRSSLGSRSDGPERKVEIQVAVMETEWWLTRWADNQIECVILVDHDGLPSPNETIAECGLDLYEEWRSAELCETPDDVSTCEGLYIFKAGQQPGERKVVVELPPAVAWVSLSGCTLEPPENLCSQIPNLLVTGQEPLPNEQIKAVHVLIGPEGGQDEFICEGEICEVPLPVTLLSGTSVEFWVDSSFGDSSEHYTALVRVIDGGVSQVPGESKWFVDVLSSRWQGARIASCAQDWEAFPPPGGPPDWLSTPEDLASLATDAPFVYLAGQLILQGGVDASGCPQGGLLPNNTANTCGLEVARELVNEWQDRFDKAIVEVAEETNVPAQLMKNVFAIESQFWPGSLIPLEFGLGQMTDLGADTTLLWNSSFFDQFCPLVLDAETCAGGYLRLDKDSQAMLRGALAVRTDSRCDDCPLGIDLANAEFSIQVFAQTLLGNCDQVGRIVRNVTGKAPGEVSSYEDLWRFTLVNYNAGPGCLSTAVTSTWRGDRVMDWVHLAPRLDLACPNAPDYVDEVIGKPLVMTPVVVTPLPIPGPSPTPTPTPTPIGAPYPAPSPRPTIVVSPYP